MTTHPHLVPRYTERSRAIFLLSPKRPLRPIRKGENLKPSQPTFKTILVDVIVLSPTRFGAFNASLSGRAVI